MIALDNEPLSLVERVGFNKLMEKAVPQYKLPCRPYMTKKVIPDIYNRICTKIKASILQATAVSVASDMWTCQQNSQSFLSFTAHWISPYFILEHSILAMKPFSGSHTGFNIAKKLNTIAERWGISHSKIHFLVHDSGANMIKDVKDAEYDSAKCFAHLLQLAVNVSLNSQIEITQMIAAARRIVTHFNHSCIAQEKLKCVR
ncbi:zinc finger BED domain-containing protein 4-like [Hydra vulgaris]|uniref:zinc finger BED domain-containing protein 4-like n=1 Tax=Hydra vulgaris TaxID=6087 RepID=UPI001F5F224A|nr:zinc finger BED domain-containing protein 4-like [Hydra vulgaris]